MGLADKGKKGNACGGHAMPGGGGDSGWAGRAGVEPVSSAGWQQVHHVAFWVLELVWKAGVDWFWGEKTGDPRLFWVGGSVGWGIFLAGWFWQFCLAARCLGKVAFFLGGGGAFTLSGRSLGSL